MKKRKTQIKNDSKNTSLLIKYDKSISKKDEFKTRILERFVVKLLGILENRRP